MSLDMYPKTIPRPRATRAFKAILPKGQRKRLGPHREISVLLVSKFKGGVIDKELEYLGYPIITKRCGCNGVAFYATGYRNGNVWEILSVIEVTQYETIIEKLKGEAMLIALIGGNLHTQN